MAKKKPNSTYLGKPVRLSLGTFDEVMGLRDSGGYDSAQDVIQEAVQALKEKKKRGRASDPPGLLDALGI